MPGCGLPGSGFPGCGLPGSLFMSVTSSQRADGRPTPATTLCAGRAPRASANAPPSPVVPGVGCVVRPRRVQTPDEEGAPRGSACGGATNNIGRLRFLSRAKDHLGRSADSRGPQEGARGVAFWRPRGPRWPAVARTPSSGREVCSRGGPAEWHPRSTHGFGGNDFLRWRGGLSMYHKESGPPSMLDWIG